MGHVAKSDGRVTEQEIDAARDAMRRFSLSEADRLRAIELFTAGKRPDFPLEGTLERLRWLAGDQSDLCRLFVQIQLEAALHGNGLGDRAARGVPADLPHARHLAARVRVARGDAAHAPRRLCRRWAGRAASTATTAIEPVARPCLASWPMRTTCSA